MAGPLDAWIVRLAGWLVVSLSAWTAGSWCGSAAWMQAGDRLSSWTFGWWSSCVLGRLAVVGVLTSGLSSDRLLGRLAGRRAWVVTVTLTLSAWIVCWWWGWPVVRPSGWTAGWWSGRVFRCGETVRCLG